MVAESKALPAGTYYHEVVDWAERFFIEGDDAELKAYKLAYAYRDSANGVAVKALSNCGHWVVNVFTSKAKSLYGIKSAK